MNAHYTFMYAIYSYLMEIVNLKFLSSFRCRNYAINSGCAIVIIFFIRLKSGLIAVLAVRSHSLTDQFLQVKDY
jgi:hypothetical protein